MFVKITDEIDKIVIRSETDTDLEAVNCYLIKGDQGVTVIDTGDFSELGIETWEKVFESGIEIEKVVLTHTHRDHIGLAKWFQETKGVPVYVARMGYSEMQKYLDPHFNEKFNDLLHKYGFTKGPVVYQEEPPIYDFKPVGFFEKDGTIKLGNDTYEIIWTPGHATDHFCFYQKERKILLAGDHVIQNVAPVIGLWTAEEANVLADYIKSMDTIKKYPVDIALAGHGETIYNLYEQVGNIRGKHLHRMEQLLEIITASWVTAEDVCEAIYGTVKAVGPFMATLTRMLYLEAEKKLERKEQYGVVYFRQNGS